MNIWFSPFPSWAKISSNQNFSNTVSAVIVEANEWMKISTGLCKGICSSFLTVKSVDQTLLSPYKFTFSDSPVSVITLSWLPKGRVAEFLSSASQRLSCYRAQEVWCIPIPLFLFLLYLIYYFHVFIIIFSLILLIYLLLIDASEFS